MGFILIAPFAVLSVWSIFAILRWLRQGGYGRDWWKAFTILSCVGVAMGAFFAFVMAYNVATKHIQGFPIPVQITNRDKTADNASQTPMPVAVHIGGMVTDFLCGVALCLAPIALAAFLKENRGKLGTEIKPNTDGPS